MRAQAVNQLLSTIGAVYSGRDSDLGTPIERAFPPIPGNARVIPSGVAATPVSAAMLMSSWSMTLDFDDVMLGGHTCHSSVLVPLSLAEGRSGEELLLAQIVANEVAARINMVCAVGSTRGQMATHLHLIAAAAARAKLEGLDEDTFADAIAWAISYPAQALFPAFLGSDAKVSCAALPIRNGMEAVDAVKAGLIPPADPLDDPRGFFATAARVPVRDFLGGLGERWHTATTSFKIYPVCGYLCSAIDATLALVREHDIDAEEIANVDVWSSVFTVGMDAHSKPYLDGRRISTLTFSTPFAVASAILARDLSPEQLKQAWIDDPRVWRLAARVQSRHDTALTLAALRGDIPVGAGLRRVTRLQAAAFGWSLATAAFGKKGRWLRPLQTLRLVTAAILSKAKDLRMRNLRSFAALRMTEHSKMTKPIGARVEIRMNDGRVFTRAVSIPRAFAGANDDVRSLMREKFVRAATSTLGAEHAAQCAATIERIEELSASEAQNLVESLCETKEARLYAAH